MFTRDSLFAHSRLPSWHGFWKSLDGIEGSNVGASSRSAAITGVEQSVRRALSFVDGSQPLTEDVITPLIQSEEYRYVFIG